MTETRQTAALLAEARELFQSGRIAEAADLYRDLCEQAPAVADAWHMLGAINGMQGNYAEAERCARQVTLLAPAAAEGHRNLGNILLQQQQPAAAEASFRRVLELEPDGAEDHNNLGVALARQDRHADANACYQRALELMPDYAAAHYNLGASLQALGMPEPALQHYQDAVRLEPGNAACLAGMGMALLQLQQPEKALAVLERAMELDAGHFDALYHAAGIYYQFGHLDKAISLYDRALAVHPGHAWLHNILGNACLEHGNPTRALECYRKAAELQPGMAEAHYNIGTALEREGRLLDALEQYRALERQDHGSLDVAGAQASILEKLGEFDRAMELVTRQLESGQAGGRTLDVFSRLCRHFNRCDQAIRMLEARLGDSAIETAERRSLHFRLGQLYDRNRQYDEAFAHYARGNALKKYRYNAVEDEEYTRQLLAAFDPRAYERIPIAEPASDVTPIFIIGMPRSGTSLVEKIISSHPRVFAGDELPYLGRICAVSTDAEGRQEKYPHYLSRLTPADCASMAREYLDVIRSLAPGAGYVTDKMPHNFLYTGLIHKLFPGAPIIHCTRDPVDVCLSCYFQDFAVCHNYAYDLRDLGHHYRLYQRIMTHFRDVLKIPVFEVCYESTVEDLDGTCRKLLSYCGLEWDPRCLEFHKSGHRTRTASYDQVRQPIYSHSVRRWRNYRKHLDPLFEALGDAH